MATTTGQRPNRHLQVCKDCAPSARFRSLVKLYGVDKHMFDAMYFEQDGSCAIPSCEREAVAVDHCHATGRVRGLLCISCNATIGFVETAGWLRSVEDYLRG